MKKSAISSAVKSPPVTTTQNELIASSASSESLARFLEDFRHAVLMQRKALFNIIFQLQFADWPIALYEDFEGTASIDFQSWLREPPCEEIAAHRYYRRLVAAQESLVRRAQTVVVDFQRGTPDATQFAGFLHAAQLFEVFAERLVAGITSSMTDIDELTGVLNRTAMERDLQRAVAQSRRSGIPFTLAMVDADHFKRVNDEYGHTFGDLVLSTLAERFEASLRPRDSVYRYGGEEFLLLMPDTPVTTAKPVLERLRRRASEMPISDGIASISITVSVGACETNDTDDTTRIIERADAALYRAKSAGRDKLILDQEKTEKG